jgi:WD repeat-containing protein 19
VLSLERIRSVEDKNLLAGHIIVLLEQDYNQAQELFLKSSQPLAALEMRKDLKQWDLALKLAKQLKPDELGSIYRENGALLEMRGEFEMALSCFERSLQHSPSDAANTALCRNGVARCTLHAGDIRRGRDLCLERNDVALFRECASILEGLNQMQESAEMYERGRLYEKAASIYIQTKSFARAQPLMAKINTPKLHVQYARAKEAEGKYDEAAVAYEMAKDTDSVVRLLLRYLNNPQKAFALVRRTRSTEGALMVAKFCQSSGDFPAAIEFLLMARRQDEAFELAQVHEAMDTYALIVGQSGQPEDYEKLASYYERKPGGEAQAGENYEKCGKYQQALRLYLKVGVAKIDAAINVVGRANNDILTNQLVDFLMGETDGIQKDHNYLFRLHMALQQFEQAAHTAVLIARQEQEMGNYKVAHAQLFDTFKELESQGKRAPTELNRQLLLLHSYVLVKTLVKLNDHAAAARMLTRVAKNISRFPRHIVPILTSTVIECQRAGFKKTAFDYASMLMRPENRKTISEQYKRKIENIVRKPEKEVVESDAKDEEVACPCPFCNTPGSETDLECDSCKNVIPYCIATGKRMVLSDWAQCPSCRFPCRASVFVKIITLERNCPMCNQQIVLSQIHKIADPITALKQQQALLQNNQREPEPELDREE